MNRLVLEEKLGREPCQDSRDRSAAAPVSRRGPGRAALCGSHCGGVVPSRFAIPPSSVANVSGRSSFGWCRSVIGSLFGPNLVCCYPSYEARESAVVPVTCQCWERLVHSPPIGRSCLGLDRRKVPRTDELFLVFPISGFFNQFDPKAVALSLTRTMPMQSGRNVAKGLFLPTILV